MDTPGTHHKCTPRTRDAPQDDTTQRAWRVRPRARYTRSDIKEHNLTTHCDTRKASKPARHSSEHTSESKAHHIRRAHGHRSKHDTKTQHHRCREKLSRGTHATLHTDQSAIRLENCPAKSAITAHTTREWERRRQRTSREQEPTARGSVIVKRRGVARTVDPEQRGGAIYQRTTTQCPNGTRNQQANATKNPTGPQSRIHMDAQRRKLRHPQKATAARQDETPHDDPAQRT